MPTFDLFSKRQRRARGDIPEVFRYDELPGPLRVQIVHVLSDLLDVSPAFEQIRRGIYLKFHNTLAREYGEFVLSDEAQARQPDYRAAVYSFFLNTDDVDRALDVVELGVRLAFELQAQSVPYLRLTPDEGIAEINERFLDSGIGFQVEGATLIRTDSTFVHAEIVKPALLLLSEKGFDGANEEFLNAHEHYRHGRYKEAMTECLKALESTIKAICTLRKWKFENQASVKRLIDVVFENSLIPTELQSEFGALRATLESGVPTVRNRMSGHGQGAERVAVPGYIASYALHLTAATIVLLMEAHRGES